MEKVKLNKNNFSDDKFLFCFKNCEIYLTEDKKTVLFLEPYLEGDSKEDIEIIEDEEEDGTCMAGSCYKVVQTKPIEDFLMEKNSKEMFEVLIKTLKYFENEREAQEDLGRLPLKTDMQIEIENLIEKINLIE